MRAQISLTLREEALGFLQQFKGSSAIAGFALQFGKADTHAHLIGVAAPGKKRSFQFSNGAGHIKLTHGQAQFHAASDGAGTAQPIPPLDGLTIRSQRIVNPAIGFGDHAAGKMEAGIIRIGIREAIGSG
jgi:hypothetical protein